MATTRPKASPMRFIHTADWQIGMRAVHVGAVAPRVREERLAAARRLIAIAREKAVDFILVAGDVFEDNAVDPVLVRKVADILEAFGGPVFVLPGNHDPLEPGSVWDRTVWSETKHVTILREAAPVEIPGGTLFPCPARSRHGGADPTAWIPVAGEGHRVGVAHGTLEGIETSEREFPIPRAAAERAQLDYLALGHWHSTVIYAAPSGAVRMAYAGTPEPTSFGERDSGNALLVEIDAPSAAPRVTPLPTGGLSWARVERAIRVPDDLATVRHDVETIENPEHTLIEVRLSGVLARSGQEALRAIDEILQARFLFGRLVASDLRPLPDDPSWLDALPAGVLREAGARLQQLSDPAFVGGRPEGVSAEVATRALIELCALAQEVSPDNDPETEAGR